MQSPSLLTLSQELKIKLARDAEKDKVNHEVEALKVLAAKHGGWVGGTADQPLAIAKCRVCRMSRRTHCCCASMEHAVLAWVMAIWTMQHSPASSIASLF
jgi:hypothetical protein